MSSGIIQAIKELEAANKRLREHEPSEGIAGLQEELISVKMREAEANLSIKEMRQRLSELEQQWAVSHVVHLVNELTKIQKYIHVRTFDPSSAGLSDGNAPGVPDTPATTPQQPSPPLTSARARLAKITASIIGTSADEDHGISVRELEVSLV